MGHRSVDKLGDKNYGSDNTGHKTDGSNNDVEISQAHHGACAKETEEENENKDTNTNNQMNCHHAHDTPLYVNIATNTYDTH